MGSIYISIEILYHRTYDDVYSMCSQVCQDDSDVSWKQYTNYNRLHYTQFKANIMSSHKWSSWKQNWIFIGKVVKLWRNLKVPETYLNIDFYKLPHIVFLHCIQSGDTADVCHCKPHTIFFPLQTEFHFFLIFRNSDMIDM